MSYTLLAIGIDLVTLKQAVTTNIGTEVKEVELVGKSECCVEFIVRSKLRQWHR